MNLSIRQHFDCILEPLARFKALVELCAAVSFRSLVDQFANRCYMELDKILRVPVTANAEALGVGLGDVVLVWDRLPPHGSRITQ